MTLSEKVEFILSYYDLWAEPCNRRESDTISVMWNQLKVVTQFEIENSEKAH